MNDIPLLNLLPEKARGWALIAIAAFPYLTRAWHGWKNEGGWRGVRDAILFGTNTPKQNP